MLHKVRVAGEVVVFAMFEDEDTLGLEQTFLEDETWNPGQLLQGIGRIGKDEVELLLARLDETEGIATKGDADLRIEFFQTVGDEAVMISILFDADDVGAAARHQFEGDAARAREEVEGCGAFKVHITRQDIEDVLLGKVGGGSCLETPWNLKVPSLVYACNDSHRPLIKSVIRS